MREELLLLQEHSDYIGHVIKVIDKKKVFVKIPLEGKFIVNVDKNVNIEDIKPNYRVALDDEDYTIHKILPMEVC